MQWFPPPDMRQIRKGKKVGKENQEPLGWVLCVGACVCRVTSVVSKYLWLWTAAHQAPLSMGFSREEYQSGSPRPPPGDFSDPGIQSKSLMSPALAGGVLALFSCCSTYLRQSSNAGRRYTTFLTITLAKLPGGSPFSLWKAAHSSEDVLVWTRVWMHEFHARLTRPTLPSPAPLALHHLPLALTPSPQPMAMLSLVPPS